MSSGTIPNKPQVQQTASPTPTPAAPKPGSQFKLKQRKREVVTKHEPEAFRDALLSQIPDDSDIELYTSVLEAAADKLDYKRYAEALFEFLIIGGLLAPGGTIVDDGARLNPLSIFASDDSTESIRQRVDVMNKLIRRYKYLQRKLEETLEHSLQYVNKFGDNSRKLSLAIGIMISSQMVSMSVLNNLNKEHLVKEGASLQFLTGVFQSYLQEQNIDHLSTLLKRSGLDDRMLEFFPPNKRQEEYLARHFEAEGLKSVVDFYKKRQGHALKDQIKANVKDMLELGKLRLRLDIIATFLKGHMKANAWPETETLALMFDAIMEVFWKNKAEQIEPQIVKSLQTWPKLLEVFCTNAKTEIVFLQRLQNVCYEDARLTKHFRTIASSLYKHDVLSEAAILYWFEKGAQAQGKAMFVKQMEPFVEWLKAQEEESEEEDDE
ncbi:armadillo-type protein [Chytridium lagenaria]|nr:armadillo-type protein [Chytridium lagenaria]